MSDTQDSLQNTQEFEPTQKSVPIQESVPIYGLPPSEFCTAFPFHLIINARLDIVQAGDVIKRLYPHIIGQKLDAYFRSRRPATSLDFTTLQSSPDNMFLLESIHDSLSLRGQMLYIAQSQTVAYLCTPWVTDIADMTQIGFHINDFAVHDSVSDYLMLLQSQKMTINETKQLTQKLMERQKELRTANQQLQREIEERMRIEQALAESRNEALHASQVKSNFLATMSHEIRTPMNGILGMGRLLIDTDLNAEQYDYASVIYQEANTLLELINNILDLSKIEADKIVLEKVVFSLDGLIGHVTKLLTPLAEKKGLVLRTQQAPNMLSHIVGDEIRLRQILVNLVNNAIKFTDSGEVILTISQEMTPPVELASLTEQIHANRIRLLKICVRDTGIGMSDEILGRLFTAFTQADTSTTRKYGGTGLGLSISKGLVDLMGGYIRVESVVRQGSTFTVFLPCVEPSDEVYITASPEPTITTTPFYAQPTDNPEYTNTGHTNTGYTNTGHTTSLILVAEDNLINQRVIAAYLRRLGYQASFVENGLKAIEAVSHSHHHYRLLFMDWQMPEMDGIEATKTIRRMEHDTGRHMPIIGMTANAMKGDREQCLAAGMDDYLTKPIRLDELRRVLMDYIPPPLRNKLN
ncbi:MAG: ATP-binding protein [Chloroflexota bacterium]